MTRLVVLAVALLGACGRIDFDPRSDVGAIDDGVTGDALPACALRQIAVGERHVCALRNDGAVYCAGDNAEGQLGTGVVSAAMPVPVLASDFTSLGIAKSVHTGRQFTCVRDINGQLFCLGDNADGQLGGSVIPTVSPTHLMVSAPAMTPEVSLGNAFSCAISLDDRVICWGDGDEGQAGNGTQPDAHGTQEVTTINSTGLHSLSAGTDHVCVGYMTNRITCWGAGTLFRLGYNPSNTCAMATAGSIPCQTQPNDLGQTFFASVSAGHEHSCAVTTFGDVRCWGSNDQGQVGSAPSTFEGLTVVVGISGAQAVAAGRHHTCAIANGAVSCWGSSTQYELGSAIADSFNPVAVTLPGPAVKLVTHAMARTTCALLDDGTASCWGANDFGQLGRGTMTTRELPAPFPVPCN